MCLLALLASAHTVIEREQVIGLGLLHHIMMVLLTQFVNIAANDCWALLLPLALLQVP